MGKKKKVFKEHSPEKQKEYEREIRLQYGPELVNESIRRYNSYTEAQRKAIGEEGNAIYRDLVAALEAGKPPAGNRVQAILARWHQHIRYFYEPPTEVLRGLGDLYTTHPDFIKNFARLHPDLGEFMKQGINVYVDALEDAELNRLFDEDARRLADS